MNDVFDRRLFLKGAVSLSTLVALGFPAEALAQESGLSFGPAEPFSFDVLVNRARKLASETYVPPKKPSPDIIARLNYEELGKIRFRPEHALWANGPVPFPVTFFHLGTFFPKKVTIHVVEDGKASELIYRKSMFDMPADSPAQAMPDDVGFAGFRFQEARDGKLDWKKNDWVAFLGASYFRAIGDMFQYGLSARGVVVNAADPNPPHQEEFPDFKEFWLEPVPGSTSQVKIYALLDGPSVSGAFSFLLTRDKAVLMDIETHLFTRVDISRFGLAPLTSMFWFSETVKPTAIDWRPEVHDSDGLAIWTGGGERIWRPLNNVPVTTASSFMDSNPRGFGLLQRDHNFDHYLDGVMYDRRPSLWVEPQSLFGEGAVQLIEIPTNDEIHDNIVAMWVPKEPVKGGQSFTLKYRLHWSADEPYPTNLARVMATRLGNGGNPGTLRPVGWRKFVVEFYGDPLKDLPYGVKPEAIVTTSRGEISNLFTEAVPDGVNGHWRAQFDLSATGGEAVEMRCYLKLVDRILSETWLYQYHPF